MTACMVGWTHSKFGKLEGEDVEALIVRVATAALADAGVAPADIAAIYLGFYNGGFSPQDFGSSLVLQADPALRFKPATRVENACATGSAAIHQGVNFLEAKKGAVADAQLAQREQVGPEIGNILMKASYLKEDSMIEGGFAGVFGRITQQYFQKYGDQTDALAQIAAKNHKNGCDNPYAQLRKDLGYEFCRNESDKNPFVAGPLKRTDCSLVSDGAAAVVLADMETALTMPKAVGFRSTAHVNDLLPMSGRDMTFLDGASRAWAQALDKAGLSLNDLSLVETHDCFTTAELMEYEAMGLAEPGQGARVIMDGVSAKDGKLPINPSGGLKSKGHPIGATGVSMHVLSAMQVRGEAGDMQVKDAKLAGLFNMGGAGVANLVSIVEALR